LPQRISRIFATAQRTVAHCYNSLTTFNILFKTRKTNCDAIFKLSQLWLLMNTSSPLVLIRPRSHERYLRLPIFGDCIEDFARCFKTRKPHGRVPIGMQRLHLEKPPGTQFVLCFHPSGHHSVLAAQPDPKSRPILLFTDRPPINLVLLCYLPKNPALKTTRPGYEF